MADKPTSDWSCAACNQLLILKKNLFSYMGHRFTHEVFCCPSCGMVLIPRDLAEGRMSEVEEQLEDK